MTIMVRVAPSTLLARIMKCDQLIYRSMVNKSQEKTKNSLECWNMKLRWMDHVDKRPNLLLPLIECLRHKVYCRLFLFLHPSVRPSTRHGQLLYHRSYFIYSPLLKMGLSSARTHPLQTNFDHPLLIHSSYSSGHYQRLNFISFFALLLQTSIPFFSVLWVPQCIPIHIHGRSAFPHHFNWIFSFPFPIPFWTNDLFCHEVGYFCCLSLPHFFFFTFTSTVLAFCSLDYGDELPPIALLPIWFLAAWMDR